MASARRAAQDAQSAVGTASRAGTEVSMGGLFSSPDRRVPKARQAEEEAEEEEEEEGSEGTESDIFGAARAAAGEAPLK